MQASSADVTAVLGRFQKRIFRSPEHYGIALYSLISSESTVPPDVGQRGAFVAKGNLIPELDVMDIRFVGRWERDKRPNGGMYFAVRSFSEEKPTTKDSIIKVLSSGIYKGIGEKTAERIYAAFKAQSIDIVTHQTERLMEVKGIGKATILRIIESVKESVELAELVAFLAEYDISLSQIRKIQKAFPDNPKLVIKSEPFKLCKIRGFGFSKVDAIAQKLGTPVDSPLRVQCAVDESLRESNSQGHLYTLYSALLKTAHGLLNKRTNRSNAVSFAAIEAELQMMEFDNRIVVDRDYEGNKIVYLKADYENECSSARRIVETLGSPLDMRRRFSEQQINLEIDEAEKDFCITLSPKQREAVIAALSHKVCVITGGPGTGKTTILRFILKIYLRNIAQTYQEEDDKPSVLLMAPTGKAARRMAESAGQSAFTLHKGLGISPGNEDGGTLVESMLDETVGLVVVDETSMMDMSIAAQLLGNLPDSAQLVLIGDVDQLPSVGAGSVLGEIIKSKAVPVARLDVIYRQGETSLIVKNSHKIRAGRTDLETSKSAFAFFGVPHGEDEKAQDQIINLYLRAAKKYGAKEVQILCPRRDEVVASARFINKRIQQRLFADNSVPKCTIGGQTYHVGERIIQTKNTDKASNGDMGVIASIARDPEQPESFIVGIQFDFMEDGNVIDYYTEDFDNVQLGYAISIHKSQGSEFQAVLIPVLQSQSYMLRRNLLYTGVTRGKEIVVLVGQAESVKSAIKKVDTNRRNTLLGARIMEKAHESL